MCKENSCKITYAHGTVIQRMVMMSFQSPNSGLRIRRVGDRDVASVGVVGPLFVRSKPLPSQCRYTARKSDAPRDEWARKMVRWVSPVKIEAHLVHHENMVFVAEQGMGRGTKLDSIQGRGDRTSALSLGVPLGGRGRHSATGEKGNDSELNGSTTDQTQFSTTGRGLTPRACIRGWVFTTHNLRKYVRGNPTLQSATANQRIHNLPKQGAN